MRIGMQSRPVLCRAPLPARLVFSSRTSQRHPDHKLKTGQCRAEGEGIPKQPTYAIPQNAEQVAQQALGASQRAWQDGIRRQQLELLLPLIGASDIDDWPGGVRQQFKAILPMVEAILKGLKVLPDLQGPLQASIWDQGDAVGAWLGKKLVAVVFPTPETLPQAQQAAGATDGIPESGLLTLLVNPQWQPGQVISDFGFGTRRQNIEKFLSGFQDVYYLKQQRILGDDILVLRVYPGEWQVHLTGQTGTQTCIHTQESKPSYKDLERILRGIQGSMSSQTWAQRLRSEFKFNKDSMNRKQ